jgi:group I intron endonuclease
MKISGIYKIQSKIKPERIYIGSSINIKTRWFDHLNHLRKNKHHSKKLQNHFNKYSETDLQFSILLSCDKDDLIKHEQFFIDIYKPWFNCSPTAGNCLGVKHSEETKNKHREMAIKFGNKPPNKLGTHHICSEETKHKISISKIGSHHTEESRNKIREASINRKLSIESRKKLSEYHKGKNFNPPVSNETKLRMSKSGKKSWELRKLLKVKNERSNRNCCCA